jgi:hypothetical protein
MTDFEFLSVLISIIIGFGLTHLLAGLGRAFHFRRVNKIDAVHVAWTIAVFFVLVLNWWVTLLWRGFENWTFAVFFMTRFQIPSASQVRLLTQPYDRPLIGLEF